MNSSSDLKKIIESISSSGSKENITALYDLIAHLKDQNDTDRTAVSLLTMIQQLAKYIDARGAKAHGDAKPLLVSLADQFDQIVQTPDMEKERVKQIVIQENKKFISLKNKILSQPVIDPKDLNDLKAVIFALEWEISSDTVQKFEETAKNLLFKLQDYKIHYIFLKIILSTGNYIGAKKASANIDAIPFLRFSFDSFEQIAQNQGMAYQQKKERLDTCIHKFHELKHQIQQTPRQKHGVSAPVSSPPEVDPDSGEEALQPALTRFKPASLDKTDNKIASLTPLPVQDDTEDTDVAQSPDFNGDKIVQPLSGEETEPKNQGDIMDDLFSPRKSPADELLDAIHQLDINGGNQDQAHDMPDTSSQAGSVTNFTPRKRDNAPIPEISTRLDEVFNLTPHTDNKETVFASVNDRMETEANDENRDMPASDSPPTRENSRSNGVIPFQNEDESFDEEILAEDDGCFETLNALHSIFKDREWMKDQYSSDAITKKISFLTSEWKDDRDKTALLEIVALLVDTAKDFNAGVDDQNGVSIAPAPPLGIFGRIRNMFQKS
ncbi:MAG: hypothetical protein U9P10_07650 [Thermodesulfobacteriota bacterium]|nr:hypothetical protein [Thermodesulfobacteriota bacterium]